jgi:hypothetical protein
MPGGPDACSRHYGARWKATSSLHRLRIGRYEVMDMMTRRATFHTDGDGALADERDGNWMGAHAVVRGAAGGVGGAEKQQRPLGRIRSRA